MVQNRDVEQSVLGAALNDQQIATTVATLDADCFSFTDTKVIHSAIKRIVSNGEVPDLVTVSLGADKELEGNLSSVVECVSKAVVPSLYKQYEKMLIDCKRRRSLETSYTNSIAKLRDPSEDVDVVMGEVKSVMDNQNVNEEGTSMTDAMEGLLEEMKLAGKDRCMTGISGIDQTCGGFKGGQLIVLGARPGVGKTALALAIAQNVANRTGPVLLVSLEMTKEEVAARMVAADSGVTVDRISTGKLSQTELEIAERSMKRLQSVPLEIVGNATTPLMVRRKALSMMQSGLKMIVIDYIQLLRSDEKSRSRYEEVSAISRELKLLAMDLKLPIVALCQLNRSSEEGGQSRLPTMAEARDSGSIEQDCNVFMILHPVTKEPTDTGGRDHLIWKMCHDKGAEWMKLSIPKNRQGKTGMIDLSFDKPHMTFNTIVDYGFSRMPWERNNNDG